jgi:hypothetical protein
MERSYGITRNAYKIAEKNLFETALSEGREGNEKIN